jgi:hypothetical protein
MWMDLLIIPVALLPFSLARRTRRKDAEEAEPALPEAAATPWNLRAKFPKP